MPGVGPDEAIRRAKLYQDAGVDLVFVDGIKHISEVEAVAKHVSGPKVISIVDGNETVALKASDLEEMGFSVVLYAVTALFAAAKAISDALGVLARDGTPAGTFADLMTYDEFSELVGLAKFQSLDTKFGGRA